MTFRHRCFDALGRDAQTKQKRLEATLQCARDIQKFEIEFYWKRAAYFGALQSISFAALGLAATPQGSKPDWRDWRQGKVIAPRGAA
jgi:hypothetical protein